MSGSSRLLKELKEIQRNISKRKKDQIAKDLPPVVEEITLEPASDSNLFLWKAHIVGPPDTPYSKGRFELRMSVPTTYPHSPPKVTFVTKCCHPNVHWKTGEICLDVLKDAWTPIWTLESLCRAVIALLGNPEPSSPLNCDVGNLLRCGDKRGYWSLAEMYTLEYAERLPQPGATSA